MRPHRLAVEPSRRPHEGHRPEHGCGVGIGCRCVRTDLPAGDRAGSRGHPILNGVDRRAVGQGEGRCDLRAGPPLPAEGGSPHPEMSGVMLGSSQTTKKNGGTMPYASGRVIHDADAHIMEVPGFLERYPNRSIVPASPMRCCSTARRLPRPSPRRTSSSWRSG